MKSNFITKALSSFFGAGILTVVNLIIVVLLARWLGPNDVGRYQLVISFSMIIGTIGTFGFHGSVVYFICNKNYELKVVFAHLLFVTFILSCIFFIISFYLFSFNSYFGSFASDELYLVAFIVPLFIIFSSLLQVFIANKNIFKFQMLQSTPRLLFLFFLVLIFAFCIVNFSNVLYITVSSSFLGTMFLIYSLRSYFSLNIKLDVNLLFEMFKFGSLMTMSYLIILLNNEAMNIFIGVFLPGDFVQVGYFSRAFRAANLLLVLSGALTPLIFSQLSSVDLSRRIEQLCKIQRVWFSLSLIAVVLLWIFSENIIVILFSNNFLPSVKIFRVLLFGRFIYSFVSFFNIFHNASGFPLYTTLIMSFNLFSLSIISFIIVPVYEGLGMAYAYVISTFLTLIFSIYINVKKYKINMVDFIIRLDDLNYICKKMRLILIK